MADVAVESRGTAGPPPVAAEDRFRRLEYPDDDFPYYRGWPTWISGRQWIFVMGALALGFAILLTGLWSLNGTYAQFIKVGLFVAIPLAALALVARPGWKAIFRRVRLKDIGWAVVFAILNLVVSGIVAGVLGLFFDFSANAGVSDIGDMSTGEIVAHYGATAIQLFGEELITILPFLALMYVFAAKMKLSRKKAMVWAWILSAVVFGALHLSTYDWNIVQAVVGIGVARLVLSLAYIKTKNIWVSTMAHVLNDWSMFTLSLIGVALEGMTK